MTQKSLSLWMKIIVIMLGICGVVLYGFTAPYIGLDFAKSYPEFAFCFTPWLVFLLLTAIPCYSVLVLAWKIATSISKDKAFTDKNSSRLKNVSILSLATSVYMFAGNVIFLALNMNHFSIFLAICLLVFVGVAISVASAVLSYLVKKAAKLQQDSDLTI